jgi:hypothetical protein
MTETRTLLRPWPRWPNWLGKLAALRNSAPAAPAGSAVPAQGAAAPSSGEAATADTLWGPGFLLGGPWGRFNPDQLVRQKGWAVYERMLRDDQVSACLALVNAAVCSRGWSFEVTDQAAQGPVVDFLRFNLNDALQGTLRQLLEQLLSARIFGFSLVEKVYGPVEWNGRTQWGLTAYKLRPAWTFTFRSDAHGNVLSLVQNQDGVPVELEPGRFVHFVFQSEFDPHYGRSSLVPAYEPWWAKSVVERFWNIYLERMASGFLHGKKGGPLSPSENASLQQALANVQAATSILTPDSVTLQYVTPPNTTAFQDREASLNRAIARALLIPTHLGFTDQGSTGSHAQAAAQVDVFFWWLDALCSALEDTLNEQLFRELVAWNFGSVPPPRFRFERRTPQQRRDIAKAWAEAVQAGTAAHGPEDEQRIRQLLDMPFKPSADGGVSVPGEDGGPDFPVPPAAKALPSNPLGTAAQVVRIDPAQPGRP